MLQLRLVKIVTKYDIILNSTFLLDTFSILLDRPFDMSSMPMMKNSSKMCLRISIFFILKNKSRFTNILVICTKMVLRYIIGMIYPKRPFTIRLQKMNVVIQCRVTIPGKAVLFMSRNNKNRNLTLQNLF